METSIAQMGTPGNRGRFRAGPENPRWCCGTLISSKGYERVRVPKDHPLADVHGYCYLHRLRAYESGLLAPDARLIVHHKDGDRRNNDPQNLDTMPVGEHTRRHKDTLHAMRDAQGRFRCTMHTMHERPAQLALWADNLWE